MANKITGSTDILGNVAVVPNSGKYLLLVGEGTDVTKEVVFNIGGVSDVSTHFGSSSAFIEIAKTLIKNGVVNIKGICIGTYDAGTYNTKALAFEGAFAKTVLDTSIMCIVLDTCDATITAKLKSHLESVEADDMFRYGIVGCASTVITVADATAIATALNSNRIFVGYPNIVNDSGTILDGIYTAACIAAVIMTQTDDPALPVSGVKINGISGVASKLTYTERGTLSDSGVTALCPELLQSIPTVYRLVTTAQKEADIDSVWHNATTRFIADNVLESVERVLRTNYTRTKNVARILGAIKTDVITVLEDKVGLEIVQDFDKSSVSVIVDPEDRYGALVDYEFKVVSPLYTITITQHMRV